MWRYLARLAILFCLFPVCSTVSAASADYWRSWLAPAVTNPQSGIGNIWIGAWPGQKGSSGQFPYIPAGSGIALAYYRENGPGWDGPTGFYMSDYEGPITAGGSYTWSGIYLWAQNCSVPTRSASVTVGTEYPHPPDGYTAHLVLDYVPESAGWTGERDFGWTYRKKA